MIPVDPGESSRHKKAHHRSEAIVIRRGIQDSGFVSNDVRQGKMGHTETEFGQQGVVRLEPKPKSLPSPWAN
jgi:hypothetical protein